MASSDRTRRLAKLMFELKRVLHERLGRRHFRLDPATLPRLAVLAYVREAGEPAMKDVAGFLRIMPPSATSLIDGLVEAKLLERRPDPKDRRTVRLRLTAKGKTFINTRFREVDRQMAQMFGKLTPQEQDQMIRLFEKLLV